MSQSVCVWENGSQKFFVDRPGYVLLDQGHNTTPSLGRWFHALTQFRKEYILGNSGVIHLISERWHPTPRLVGQGVLKGRIALPSFKKVGVLDYSG